jgi:hypothetical protein
MLYAFFWVIPRRLNFICRRFGTLCLFHLHRQVGACRILHAPTCLWRWKCSETSAYKIETPGNYPKESIQHSEHGESLKSRKLDVVTQYIKLWIILRDDLRCHDNRTKLSQNRSNEFDRRVCAQSTHKTVPFWERKASSRLPSMWSFRLIRTDYTG